MSSGKIDKSFTRKDLLEMVDNYEMEIEDAIILPKGELQNEIVSYLKYNQIAWNAELPDINSSVELLEYLEITKPNLELNYKDKQLMIHRAKKIINYCRSSYSIALTDYKSIDEIYNEGLIIAEHGDIPTCRRAVNELNNDQKIRNKIELQISTKIKQKLSDKEINKKELLPTFKVTKGCHLVSFD
tara:strand:+ start:832 stop:1389 length:558 start_codon:yes stop_codon:yes gene_type:complete